MNKTALGLCVLVFTAAFADARGQGGRSSGRRGFSGRGGFSRRLSRPKIARATSGGAAATNEGVASRTGSGSSSSAAKGRSAFARATPGGGGTGGPPTGGTTTGGSTTGTAAAQSPSAAIGAKSLSAGQQPQYTNAGPEGTLSVNGGGFVAIDQAHAGDVGRGPGVTWGGAAPGGTKAGGLASMYGGGGSTFDPSF